MTKSANLAKQADTLLQLAQANLPAAVTSKMDKIAHLPAAAATPDDYVAFLDTESNSYKKTLVSTLTGQAGAPPDASVRYASLDDALLDVVEHADRAVLRNGDFAFDLDGDGLADGWEVTTNGSTGTVTHTITESGALAHSGKRQNVIVDTLGSTTGDSVMLSQTVERNFEQSAAKLTAVVVPVGSATTVEVGVGWRSTKTGDIAYLVEKQITADIANINPVVTLDVPAIPDAAAYLVVYVSITGSLVHGAGTKGFKVGSLRLDAYDPMTIEPTEVKVLGSDGGSDVVVDTHVIRFGDGFKVEAGTGIDHGRAIISTTGGTRSKLAPNAREGSPGAEAGSYYALARPIDIELFGSETEDAKHAFWFDAVVREHGRIQRDWDKKSISLESFSDLYDKLALGTAFLVAAQFKIETPIADGTVTFGLQRQSDRTVLLDVDARPFSKTVTIKAGEPMVPVLLAGIVMVGDAGIDIQPIVQHNVQQGIKLLDHSHSGGCCILAQGCCPTHQHQWRVPSSKRTLESSCRPPAFLLASCAT
jgi:hypothetical protein